MEINLLDMKNYFAALWNRISQASIQVNTSDNIINDDQYALTPEIIPGKIDENQYILNRMIRHVTEFVLFLLRRFSPNFI